MRFWLRLLFIPLLCGHARAEEMFDPFGVARIDERPGTHIPLDVPLLDQRGQRTSLRRIAQGRVLLLAPVLHECPNFCGVTLAGLSDAIAAQSLSPGRDFALVAFGIDPRENVRKAARDVQQVQERHPITATATVAPEASIRAVTDALGYHFAWDERVGQYAHVAAIAVVTPEGRLSGWLYGLTPRPAAVTRAIVEARAERTIPLGERLRLLCFHYDPATGRYTPAIDRMLKAAALTTVLLLGAILFRLRKAHG